MAKIKPYKGIKLNSKLPKNLSTILKPKKKKKPDYSHPVYQFTSQRKEENFMTDKNFWIATGKVVGWSFIVPFAMFAGLAVIFGGKAQD
mgnify:CR=1 FL=1